MKISPQHYSLPARTILEQLDDNTIAIVINRKSRIIMTDGRKIQEKAEKITQVHPSTRVVLKTTAPVCSKTTKYLENKGIEIILCASDE